MTPYNWKPVSVVVGWHHRQTWHWPEIGKNEKHGLLTAKACSAHVSTLKPEGPPAVSKGSS